MIFWMIKPGSPGKKENSDKQHKKWKRRKYNEYHQYTKKKKKIRRGCYEVLNANKADNLEEMDVFIEGIYRNIQSSNTEPEVVDQSLVVKLN